MEYPQREIVSLITDAGLTPSNSDLTQLPQAVQAGKVTYAVDSGTANTVVIALTPTPTAWRAGMDLRVKIAANSTGASTLSITGLSGSKTIVRKDGGSIFPLDLRAGAIADLTYDGTNVQLTSHQSAGALGPVTRVLYISSTQTVTAAADEVAAQIRVYGGGGGGGASGSGGVGSGGGGAEYAEGYFSVAPSTGYTATVGAGGAGGTGTGNGAAGGTSSFGYLVTAVGGGGGFGGTGGIQATAGSSGTGGTGGQMRFAGSTGSVGQLISGGVYLGSIGGYSYGLAYLPLAFNVITSPIAGFAGAQPGNGGGGGIDGGAGGAGFPGAMIVTFYAA